MKKRFIIFTALISVLLITSCARGLGTAQNWPGVAANEANDLVYLAFGNHVYFIDLETGDEEWRFPAESDKRNFFAPPALSEDGTQLIVGDSFGILYSLNATEEQSAPNWTFDPADDIRPQDGTSSQNNNAGGRYIAGALIQNDMIYAPVSNGHLYALNLEGEYQWEYSGFQSSKSELWAAPTISDDVLYLPSMDHNIYAVDPSSGELLWKTKDSLGGALAGTPAVNDLGELFIGTLGSKMIRVYTEDNGNISDELPANGWIWSGPALVEDKLYYGDLTGTFYAVDTNTGNADWTFTIDPSQTGDDSLEILSGISPQSQIGIAGTPLILEDIVYFVSENSQFFALDADNGDSIRGWPVRVDGSLYPGPVLAGENLLIAQVGADDLLSAFDVEGRRLWTFRPVE